MKKISIITVNYNNAIGLQKTILSVTSQSFQDFEHIIIDGNSTDDSVEIIKQNSSINYWISEKDTGIYNAQNKGILKAKGEYLLFLNSGDILENDKTLETVSKYLNTNDIIYGDIITQSLLGQKEHLISPDVIDVYHLMISTLWHPSAFIHNSVFKKVGNYNETFKITADYEFFIRAIVKNNASAKHINIPIAIFNLEGISNNANNKTIQEEERKKSWEVNFSPMVIDTLSNYIKVLRSGEYKIGTKIKRIKNLFDKK